MGLLDSIKLQKLTVKAYKTPKRASSSSPKDHIGSFEAMYNPEEFSQKYEIEYAKNQGINSTNKVVNYSRSKPRELNFKLVLDGTGVDQFGIFNFKTQKTVSDRVKEFIDLTFSMNGDIHEPNYLVVEWGGKEDGGLIFSCRLGSVDVQYTSFNRDGSPLRAVLDATFISDQDVKKRIAQDNKKSPDLTHSRLVKSGDTLPLLCKEIYGKSSYYLFVAKENKLNNFRKLTPGQMLYFPPLEKK